MIGATYIECVSGALADGLQAEISASVQVMIDNTTVITQNVLFQYKQNPVFESLTPRMTIPS